MTAFVANQYTVRERAMVALKTIFDTQTAVEPSVDPYGFAWDLVLRSPLKDWAFKKQRSLGIFDMHESKVDRTSLKECTLRIALEIHLVIQSDENPSVEMNALFGSIQRRIQEDYSLGGLVIDIQEVSNDLQLDDVNNKYVVGVMFLNMKYRHSLRDPRQLV